MKLPWIAYVFLFLSAFFVLLTFFAWRRRKAFPFRYKITTHVLPNGSRVYSAYVKSMFGWYPLGPGGHVMQVHRHSRNKEEACSWATMHAQDRERRLAGTDAVSEGIEP